VKKIYTRICLPTMVKMSRMVAIVESIPMSIRLKAGVVRSTPSMMTLTTMVTVDLMVPIAVTATAMDLVTVMGAMASSEDMDMVDMGFTATVDMDMEVTVVMVDMATENTEDMDMAGMVMVVTATMANSTENTIADITNTTRVPTRARPNTPSTTT